MIPVIWENIGKKVASIVNRVRSIAIICEDNSDFSSLRSLIRRLTGKQSLTFKKKIGDGCGKIRRKCLAWSDEFARNGCDMLIVVHDRDKFDYSKLHIELTDMLKGSTFVNRYICIPVEELEAWFLSDPESIKSVMKLDRVPKVKGSPETIPSPKEFIGEQIRLCSNSRVTYLNTTHNEKISKVVSIELLLNRCPSFRLFSDFVLSQKYS